MATSAPPAEISVSQKPKAAEKTSPKIDSPSRVVD
jgi:hypothetical protein